MSTANNGGGINANRLFMASVFSLIATSVAFAAVGAVMGSLKANFILTNEQVGWIAGAALWGFTITIFVFGPLVDLLGMRLLMRFALVAHALGVLIMIFANGFTMLFVGALIIALGNGTVEAVCNPLVATLYPDKKTEMLNKFHVWFPGGIVIGGLIAYGIDFLGFSGAWQVKLLVVLVPTVIYGYLFWGQDFPKTERVQSGISFGDMVKATLTRPLFLILFFAMMITASVELGPNRWVPAVLESAGMPGILVLVWINLLMAILRFYAGSVVKRISPIGVLFLSSVISGLGLWWLSNALTFGVAIFAGTAFAVGVAFFWPTMLGVTAERVPKGGAFSLALMGGMGMAIVGLVTSPMMGRIADESMLEVLDRPQANLALTEVVKTFPELKEAAGEEVAGDYDAAYQAAYDLVMAMQHEGTTIDDQAVPSALRSAISVAPESSAAARARAVLGPAENYGGRVSFFKVAPLTIILALIFGLIYWRDRSQGGYMAESITKNTEA